MDREAIVTELDACLLTDEEMDAGPFGWGRLPDPLPAWRLTSLDHDHADA